MKQIVFVAGALLACGCGVAAADDFRCLEGAKDSGPHKEGDVLRWCEISKDGRPVYHGSVWHWHPNGQLAGKGYYVYGKAEGEWSSWFANGKPSSLGAFKDDYKTGPWKYWDQAGWLRSEVNYGDSGAALTEYYPDGKIKANGQFTHGGKIGVWTLRDASGNETATCDFGNGLFELPSPSCRTIADELEPKGYSQPIPVASARGTNIVLTIASQSYRFSVPHGWVADTESGKNEQATVVLYPKGSAWRGAGPNMYVRVFYKKGQSLDELVKNEADNFQQDVADYAESSVTNSKLKNGRPGISKNITYRPLIHTDSPFAVASSKTVHEIDRYIEVSDQVVLLLVLACDDAGQLKKAAPAFSELADSLATTTATGAN